MQAFDGHVRDYYVRQLWDGKFSADIEAMPPDVMRQYAQLCGWTLARVHARSGDRIALAAYLGAGPAFDRAIAAFSSTYADQNERDFDALRAAVASGRVVRRDRRLTEGRRGRTAGRVSAVRAASMHV